MMGKFRAGQEKDEGDDQLAPQSIKIKVVALPERKYSVWIEESF